MKKMKRVTAVILCLCLLIGLPISVQAVGQTANTFNLLSAMVVTSRNRISSADVGVLAVLYLNGQSTHSYANLNGWYDVAIEVVSGSQTVEMCEGTFAASNNYWHSSSAPSAMQSVRCPAVKFADETVSFASYIQNGATGFRLYITEKQSNNNEKLDRWQSAAGLSLTANGTYQNRDAVICDIVTPDTYLTVLQAVKTSDTTVEVQLSEPAVWPTLYNGTNTGTVAVTLTAGDKTYTATGHSVDAGNPAWVTFTFPQMADVPAGQTAKLKIAEVTDHLNALQGQASHNALVDSVVSTQGNKILYADGRAAADTASISVELSPLILTGAVLYGDTHVGLSFSKAVQLPVGNAEMALGIYKDNRLYEQAGLWPVDATTASYYSAGSDALILKVSSHRESIRNALAQLGEGYTVGLTVQSRTTDDDGRINEIKSSDATGGLLANIRQEQDGLYAKVEMKEALLELVDVEAYREDTLLLRFNMPVEYDSTKGYLGLSLLNPADGNRFFYYSEQAPHTIYTYSEYQADPTGKKLCQWTSKWVGYYQNDKATVEVRLANGWTMPEVLDICEGSGGKLYLRIQENADHDPNSGTVGVVKKQGRDGSLTEHQFLATNRGNQDQVWFEVKDCRNEIVVESAVLVADDTIRITFNKAVTNRMYNPDQFGSALLRLAKKNANGKWVGQNIFDGQEARLVQWPGKLTNYDPNHAPDVLPDAAEQTQVWYFRWADNGTDTTIRDLLTMVKDPDSVYADYELMLVLERNHKRSDGTALPVSPNSVDNYTNDADGDGEIDYILIQNNYNDGVTKYGTPGYYAAIEADGLSELLRVDSLRVVRENQMEIVFSDTVASMKNVKTTIDLIDGAGKTVQSYPVTLTSVDGRTYLADLAVEDGSTERNFSSIWQRTVAEGGKLMLKIAQTTKGLLRDGMVDGVRGAGSGKLISSICLADQDDACYKEITLADFAYNPEPLQVEKVTQVGAHTITVDFSDDIRMLDKESLFVGLRMIDPGKNGAVVKVGSREMQWQAESFDYADGNQDVLLVTFADSIDVGVLVSKINMDESFIPYDVVFVLEEASTDAVRGNDLVHNIRRATDEKQLDATATYGGATLADRFCSDVELIDPTADVLIEKVEVVDQSRIVLTFSEAVIIDSPEAFIRLVDGNFDTMTDSDGNRVMWGGQISYYNDAQTQLVFTLYGPGVSHANLIVDGLDELFNAGYEKDGWNLMLAIGDRGSSKVLNGLIDSIVSTTGKILLADVFTGIIDQVFLDIDASQIPQGDLALEKIELVSDIEAIATFSAPLEIVADPYIAIRLFDNQNRLIRRTADGAYTTASKGADGKNTSPMQWSMKWAYADAEQKQLKLTVSGMVLDMGSYTEILSYDWKSEVLGNCDEDIRDVSLLIGFEELNPKGQNLVIGRNNRIDNIRLKSNKAVALTANRVGSYDGCYLAPVVKYTAKPLTASARILNEMQVRVTFSAPVQFVGNPFMALRYVDADNRFQVITRGEAPNQLHGQWSGDWAWENEAHTSLIWTMKGNNTFGVNNISDIINGKWAMPALPAGGTLMFCIEEKNQADGITVSGRNMLVDNVATKDGMNHLQANRAAGYDSINFGLNTSDLKGAAGVSLISARAVDDQTVELTFSEGVTITEDAAMNLYYRSIAGDIEMLSNGKTAIFKGVWEYKDADKNVILWKLDSKNADSLTDIYQYAGNLKWNVGADVIFLIENKEEKRPSQTERMWGISSLDGYRLLCAPYSIEPVIEIDVEMAYDLPDVESSLMTDKEEAVRYVTNYKPFVLGAGGAVLLMAVATVLVLLKKKRGTDR